MNEVAQAETKGNIFARIWRFFAQVVLEMKKVTYPTKEELVTYFTVVLVFVVALMVLIGILDVGLKFLASLAFSVSFG